MIPDGLLAQKFKRWFPGHKMWAFINFNEKFVQNKSENEFFKFFIETPF